MLEWLIIGGGIHGCTIAGSLTRFGGVRTDAITILDPHEEPLAAWYRTTRACGMRFLRSPAAHALIPDFTAMLAWGRRHGFDRASHTIPPYARPSLELFNAHARAVIDRDGLAERLVHDRAIAVVPDEAPHRSWTVSGSSGARYQARRVVLAPGRAPGLNVPPWATDTDPSRVIHVFDDHYSSGRAERAERPLVVGAGVTAAHLALSLARRGVRVRIVARHGPRVHQFDSDPCFIGPSCMERFLAEADPDRRRQILVDARHRGSMPPELAQAIDDARAKGTIEFTVDEITRCSSAEGAPVRLVGRDADYESDLVVLATGFEPGPAAPRLLSGIRDAWATGHGGAELPQDSAGYPVPTATLEWAPGLYVTGALAELELGPSAPNIVGAHNAAKRMIAALHGSPRRVPGAWHRYAPASVSSSSDSV